MHGWGFEALKKNAVAGEEKLQKGDHAQTTRKIFFGNERAE